MKLALLKLLAAFLILAVTGAESLADDAEPARPLATAHPSEFIAASQIPEATEMLQQTLRRLDESAQQRVAIVTIAQELPAIREQTLQRIEQTNTLLASNPTLDALRVAEAD